MTCMLLLLLCAVHETTKGAEPTFFRSKDRTAVKYGLHSGGPALQWLRLGLWGSGDWTGSVMEPGLWLSVWLWSPLGQRGGVPFLSPAIICISQRAGGGGGLRSATLRNSSRFRKFLQFPAFFRMFSAVAFCLSPSRVCWCPWGALPDQWHTPLATPQAKCSTALTYATEGAQYHSESATYLALTPAATFYDTCRHLPDVCVCVCVFPCASTKLPDTCRTLPGKFVIPADTCRKFL